MERKVEPEFESVHPSAEWGEVIDTNKKEGVPIVFNFRPKTFVAVSRDRLKDWEELMRKEVGLVPDRTQQRWSGHPCETISGSNGGWDDSDCW